MSDYAEKLAFNAFTFRQLHPIRRDPGHMNVSGVLLIVNGKEIASAHRYNHSTNVYSAREQKEYDEKNFHSERLSIPAAITTAILHSRNSIFCEERFAEMIGICIENAASRGIDPELELERYIINLLCYDYLAEPQKHLNECQIKFQNLILSTIGQLEKMIVYTEREPCPNEKNKQPGCKTYLELLQHRIHKTISTSLLSFEVYYSFPRPDMERSTAKAPPGGNRAAVERTLNDLVKCQKKNREC